MKETRARETVKKLTTLSRCFLFIITIIKQKITRISFSNVFFLVLFLDYFVLDVFKSPNMNRRQPQNRRMSRSTLLLLHFFIRFFLVLCFYFFFSFMLMRQGNFSFESIKKEVRMKNSSNFGGIGKKENYVEIFIVKYILSN